MNLLHPAQDFNVLKSSIDPLEDFVAKLKRVRSLKTLQTHQKTLQFLALDFDPFTMDLSSEAKQILAQYHLEALVSDPFQFTNVLLRMLDLLEERIKTFIH